MRACGSFFAMLAIFAFAGAAEIKDTSTGEVFPEMVSFTHEGKEYNLSATGVSTRKKLIIKVYSVASYLQKDAKGNSALEKILSPENAKQLTLKWVRDVPASKILEGYRDSFKTAAQGKENALLQKEIDQYLSFFNHDVVKGEEQVLRWIPGGYIEVEINGKVAGSLRSEPFAEVLWNIWFGSKSVVNRDQLINLM